MWGQLLLREELWQGRLLLGCKDLLLQLLDLLRSQLLMLLDLLLEQLELLWSQLLELLDLLWRQLLKRKLWCLLGEPVEALRTLLLEELWLWLL